MAESVAAALGRFSEILGKEVARQDVEEQKERRNISTQRITDAFQMLGPNHDEEDVRKLMIETIADSSALETLDTSMPLIQGLYNDSITSIKRYKAEAQDEALKLYAQQKGFTGPEDITGAMQVELRGKERAREFTVESYDPDRGTVWTRLDEDLQKIGERILDPRTDTEALEMEFKKIRFTEQIRSQYRTKAENITYAGTTKEGLPISFNKMENMFYVPYTDPNTGIVSMRPLGSEDQVVRGSQSAMDEALKNQRLWTSQNKEIVEAGNLKASALLENMGLKLPISATGQVAVKPFAYFMGLSDKQINEQLMDLGLIDDEGNVTPGRMADYNVLNMEIEAMKDYEATYKYNVSQIQQSTSVVDYGKALGTYGLTPQEFKTYYGYARDLMIFEPQEGYTTEENDATIKFRNKQRQLIVDELGLKESQVSKADDSDWVGWWDKLNDKTKGKIMGRIRDELK